MKFPYLIVAIVPVISIIATPAMAIPFSEIAQRSQKFTVLITNSNGSQGSGVIIKREGEKYTILTAAHVLCGNNYQANCDRNLRYQIATNIDRYSANLSSVKRLPDRIDLAIVQFRSKQSYPTATIGDSDRLAIGLPAYIAGFPAPTIGIEKSLFVANEGKVIAVASGNRRINKYGYGVIYNTPTLPGMSGGGVYNDRGELVAIHGQGDRDLETGAKTGNNLGIPINNFVKSAGELGLNAESNRPIAIVAPQTADDFLITGVGKYNEGNKSGSLSDFQRAIDLKPKFAVALYQRGYVRLDMGKTELAIADFTKAIEIDPTYISAYFLRGLAKIAMKDNAGALSDFDRTIALDPQYLPAYIRRGNMRDESKDFTGAIADYTTVIKLDPNNPKRAKIYYQRGWARYQSGDKQNAILDFERAIEFNPRYALVYYKRGIARAQSQDRQGAIGDLQTAAKLFQLLRNKPLYEEVLREIDRLK